MPRLSIELTEDEHRRLKASAAIAGSSLKDFVLSRALADTPAADDLAELAAVLKPRIARADRGEVSSHSIKDIARRARNKRTA
jgi:hypothetical protein